MPGGDDTKPWIEGLASDTQVQDEFAVHYGSEIKEFLQSAVACAEKTEAIGTLYNKVITAGALDTHLSRKHDTFTIMQGAPMIDVVPITATSHTDAVVKLRARCIPFKTATAATAATAPTTTGGSTTQFTADAFATALASKEDRKEREKMQTGHDKLMAMFVAGVIDDVEKGTLTSVALCIET